MISKDGKKRLIEIARESINNYLLTGKVLEPPDEAGELSEKKGAFVTIKESGRLRGCIGQIHSTRPLYLTIADMAVEAAFHDPRFEPLDEDELAELEIEISVLSPLERVKDVSEIVLGEHGLLIQKGFQSGLFLPQVATENKWGLSKFLDHLCLKAGLPKGSWSDADLSKFTAEVFGERLD
ncbi:MAG: AmmeMemoRadiSam system protein A [Candidatus Eisenbacteria bacterium]|nr:AmmeMemoRadiSam system protein A [Candidatus Eisenbacteria bacterium]